MVRKTGEIKQIKRLSASSREQKAKFGWVLVSNIKDLTETCNRKFRCHHIKFVKWSFTNNFEDVWKLISDDFNNLGLNNDELKQFIDICNNRLEHSKTFLNDVAVVFGFDLLALSIIANIAIGGNKTTILLPYFSVILVAVLLLIILIILLLLPILLLLMIHYRSDIHAWTVFKEIALMKQSKYPADQQDPKD